ncbi:hypothetical protein [Sphingomonas sp.]|uniref:hypothetical protein n=1 Tax=Sphingomonas sp. TaxID=28214 RepID=UPI0035BC547F
MSEWIVESVPNARVKSFCKLRKAIGAIKCEPKDNGDQTSDITVVFPEREKFADQQERINR